MQPKDIGASSETLPSSKGSPKVRLDILSVITCRRELCLLTSLQPQYRLASPDVLFIYLFYLLFKQYGNKKCHSCETVDMQNL